MAFDVTYWVYMIQSASDNSIYTGITRDVSTRISEHNSGKGAHRTRGRGPWSLLAAKKYVSKSAALKMEIRVKGRSHTGKLKLAREWLMVE